MMLETLLVCKRELSVSLRYLCVLLPSREVMSLKSHLLMLGNKSVACRKSIIVVFTRLLPRYLESIRMVILQLVILSFFL